MQHCLKGMSTAFFFALILSLSSLPLLAQMQFTGVRGNVEDETGARVTQVEITATEEATGLTRTTISNELGIYELGGLPPGTYTISAELAGFKTYANSGIIIYAARPRRVDITLEVGDITDSITVEEMGAVIETDKSSVTYTTPMKEVEAFRMAASLIYTVGNNPGAENRSQVHGAFANNTSALQDGVATNAYGTFRAPQELVKELNQVSLNAPAEYKTATTINGVGRSGTNAFHGEIYYQVRHPRLRTLRAFETRHPSSKPDSQWNYEASGPIHIPKVYDGRDKTFFHFFYQPRLQDQKAPQTDYVYPTAQIRAGDMNQIVQQQGVTLINPFTGAPFPNNIIPANMLSPVAQATFKYVPMPNFGPAGNLVDNFHGEQFGIIDESHWHLRLDHAITDSNTISFNHYGYNRLLIEGTSTAPLANFQTIDATRMWSIQDSHMFSPSVINEFQYGRNRQGYDMTRATVSGNGLIKEFGIDLGGRQPREAVGCPHMYTGVWGFQPGGHLGSFSPGELRFPLMGRCGTSTGRDNPNVWMMKDVVSVNKGSHLIKFGIELNWERPWEDGNVPIVFGRYNFTGLFSGSDMGDYLLGLPWETSIETDRPRIYAHGADAGFFIQDDWKVTPRLTMTYGTRFQHYGAPTERDGLFYNFDFENSRVVVPDKAIHHIAPVWPTAQIPVVTASDAGYPQDLVNFSALHISPRFGLAFRINDKTVIRAGYGIYHVPFAIAGSGPTGLNRAGWLGGREAGPFVGSESFGPNEIVNGSPTLTFTNPFPPAGSGAIPKQGVRGIPLDSRSDAWAYDQQYNLTLENDLGDGWATRISYVASKGTSWPYRSNLQTALPSTVPFADRPDSEKFPWGENFSFVDRHDLGGTGTYHALELEATRQFSQGIYVRSWYEWKKNLSDVEPGLFSSTIGFEAENPLDRARDKGIQSGIARQRWRIATVWGLPVGRGQRFGNDMGGVLNALFGNWSAAFINRGRVGSAATAIYSGSDPSGTGRSGGRPDALCDGNNFGPTPGQGWDRSCFAIPEAGIGRYGSASRGSLFGSTDWGADLNLFKRFRLTKYENGPYFNIEMYGQNIFNHRNASGAGTNITSANFGLFKTSGGQARWLHFRLRLGF
jgi:hypothetical protein